MIDNLPITTYQGMSRVKNYEEMNSKSITPNIFWFWHLWKQHVRSDILNNFMVII